MQLIHLLLIISSCHSLDSILYFGCSRPRRLRNWSALWAVPSWLPHMVAMPLWPALFSGLVSLPSCTHFLHGRSPFPLPFLLVCPDQPLVVGLFIYQPEPTRGGALIVYAQTLMEAVWETTVNPKQHSAKPTAHVCIWSHRRAASAFTTELSLQLWFLLGMCPDVHVVLRGCYRQGAIVTMKHCHGRQVEEERVISSSRAVMTGAQVRLEPEAGAHWEAMEGWVLLTGSLPMVFSACFIIKPRTTSPGMEPPAMGWGLGPPPSIAN